jgi:hypothetical protein
MRSILYFIAHTTEHSAGAVPDNDLIIHDEHATHRCSFAVPGRGRGYICPERHSMAQHWLECKGLGNVDRDMQRSVCSLFPLYEREGSKGPGE